MLQDPDTPLIFVTKEDLAAFTAGSLIVDVSCDVGMGFSWAHPTSFTHPVIELTNGAHYYAVDHSPSYLWNSATWEISEGVVLNPGIPSFQHRDDAYPHLVSSDRTEQFGLSHSYAQ